MAFNVSLPASEEKLSLDEFLYKCDEIEDIENDDSLVKMAPFLAALARNKNEISRLLRNELSHFLHDSDAERTGQMHSDQCVILARRPKYYVRLATWAPPAIRGGNDTWDKTFYVYDFPHNHSFSLLTVGLYGPGYFSENHSLNEEPRLLNRGSKVRMTKKPDQTLSEGTVLLYRSWHDIHTQHPPVGFSMSLNLIVAKPQTPQYTFNTENATVDDHIGGNKSEQSRVLDIAKSCSPEMVEAFMNDLRLDPGRRNIFKNAIQGASNSCLESN